jgi:glycosyltransferase involved in cell wall biosynthesis
VISGRNIICFASGWDYHPTSKHHIMRQLSRCNNIIWINWHCSRRPTLGLGDLRSMTTRLWQIRQGARSAGDAITVLTPWQVPLPESRAVRRFNAMMTRRAINKVLHRLPKRPVQIWSFAPDTADLVGSFDEEAVVYYCVDAFGEFSGYNRRLIEQRERELIDRSDVVITTSPPLFEGRRNLHRSVHYIEHGVDHAHLSRALEDATPVPADIAALPRPIFGFVGVVGDWVDVNLVAELARRRPEASIVMIGPATASIPAAASLPNVHWLGGRDHKLLPGYLKAFDVGLIPFRQVPLTHNANPIKLYEYVAAGVPTVSTSLPAVKPIDGSVWLADDADSIARCCDEALRHNTAAERSARSKLMLAHSWSQRLEQISTVVESALRPVAAHDSLGRQVVRTEATRCRFSSPSEPVASTG